MNSAILESRHKFWHLAIAMAEMAEKLSAYDYSPLLTGELHLLTPQHWGIIAGSLVYVITVSTVITLLVLGGTCRRLKEQADAFEVKGKAAFAAPAPRMLLYGKHERRRTGSLQHRR